MGWLVNNAREWVKDKQRFNKKYTNMAIIGSAYVKLDRLRQIVEACEENGLEGFGFDVLIGDANKYNQNISFCAAQTKQQREAKEKKFYWANGRVVWKDDKAVEVIKVVAEG